MQTKPNMSPERLAQLRAENQQLRPMLAAEMPAVRDGCHGACHRRPAS